MHCEHRNGTVEHADTGTHLAAAAMTMSIPPPPGKAQSAPPQPPQPELVGGPDLLSEIVSTSLGPLSRLSETVDMTLKQVSEWIARPENRRDIFNLIGLLNAQTELLMAQHRVSAAARLVRLAHDEAAGPETARRACKDLLKLRLVERARPPGQGPRGGDDLEPLPLPAPPAPKVSLRQIMRELNGQ